MRLLVTITLLCFLHVPLSLLLNRLQLRVVPARKTAPAQGTILRSSLASTGILALCGYFLFPGSAADRLFPLLYLLVLLACCALVFVSVMCVSESGRRFYLMNLIDRGAAVDREGLRACYTREHMLSIRLQRLCAWGVLKYKDKRYYLVRPSAYLYSAFFHLWGRLLGFKWFG